MASPQKKNQRKLTNLDLQSETVVSLPTVRSNNNGNHSDIMEGSMMHAEDTEDFTKSNQFPLLMRNSSGRLRFFSTLQKQAPILLPEQSISKINIGIPVKSSDDQVIHHKQNESDYDDDDDDDDESDMSIDGIRRGVETEHRPVIKDLHHLPHTDENQNNHGDDLANQTVNSNIVESPLQTMKLNFSSDFKINSRKRSHNEDAASPLKNISLNLNSANKNLNLPPDESSANVSSYNIDNSPGVLHNSKPLNQIPALGAPSPTNQSSPLLELKMVSPGKPNNGMNSVETGTHTSTNRKVYLQTNINAINDTDEVDDINLSPLGSMVKRRKLSHSQNTSHSHIIEDYSTTMQELNHAVNKELLSYKESIESKNTKISNLLDDVYVLDRKLIDLTNAYDSLKLEKSELLKNFELAKFENKNNFKKINNITNEIKEYIDKIDNLTVENEKLINIKIELNNEKNQKLIDYNNLQLQFKNKEIEYKELKNELSKKNEDLEDYFKQIQDLQSKNDETLSEFNNLKNNILKNTSDENLELLEKIKKIESDSTKQINELTDLLEKQTEELKLKNESVEELTLSKNELTETCNSYKTKIESMKELVETLQLDLKFKEEQIKKSSDNNSTTLHEQIQHSSEEKESLKKKYEVEVENLKTKIETLNSKIEEFTTKEDEFKKTIASLQKTVRENEIETTKTMDRLGADLHTQYAAKHESKVMTLKKLYEEKNAKQMAKVESENNKLKLQLETLQAKLDAEILEKKQLVEMWEKQQQ